MPSYESILRTITEKDSEVFLRVIQNIRPVDQKGRYLHWDKLRHLSPLDELNSQEWWFRIKTARRNLYQSFPLQGVQGNPFHFATPGLVLRELHWLDRYAAGNIRSSDAITNKQTRNTI